jgi:hypothetical protein
MEVLLAKLKQIQRSLQERTTHKQRLLENATTSSVVRVNFQKILFPGTQIFFSDGMFETFEPLKGPASLELTEDRSSITQSNHKPLECVLQLHIPDTESHDE